MLDGWYVSTLEPVPPTMILWSVLVACAEEAAEAAEVVVGVVAVAEAAEAVVEVVEFPKALDWNVEKLAAPLIANTMPTLQIQEVARVSGRSELKRYGETCLVDSG